MGLLGKLRTGTLAALRLVLDVLIDPSMTRWLFVQAVETSTRTPSATDTPGRKAGKGEAHDETE